MAYFFTKITADHWTAKNKLQEEVKKLAREMDRRLLRNFEVATFIIRFRKKIKESNDKYPRCKPVEIEIEPFHSNKEETSIYVSEVFWMAIYKAKEVIDIS
jgi:hypothetical protein